MPSIISEQPSVEFHLTPIKAHLSTADLNARDKSGNTCITIALKNNQSKIINYVDSYTAKSKDDEIDFAEHQNEIAHPLSENKCDTCCVVFKSKRLMKQHFTSTIHLLNVERKEINENGGNPKVHYGIPQSNRGFQMMLTNGWDSNQGLGPSGKGKLYPVKTVLKRDRNGLGLHNETKELDTLSKKAKVTHFGPYDSSSVTSDENRKKVISPTSNKYSQRSKTRKEKYKEINFRRQFSSF